MNRKAYPTDLKDAEWELLEPLLPKAKPGGRPRSVDLREILNAIFYRERTGCAWEMLPHVTAHQLHPTLKTGLKNVLCYTQQQLFLYPPTPHRPCYIGAG